MELTERFDPVKFSIPECKFLLDHLGESPSSALESATKEIAVTGVKAELERFYELQERDKTPKRINWVGMETVKSAIQTYINQLEKWESDYIRTRGRAPRHPSMCTFDSKGRPYLGGVGSDSGIIKTYFNGKGERVPFAIDVIKDDTEAYVPEWIKGTDAPGGALKDDVDNHRLECTICGHTETYRPEARSSVNAAKARMMKHFKTDKNNETVTAHREALLELRS